MTAGRPAFDRDVRHTRTVLAGFLRSVGAVAMVDEVVFHQLLHWHHFYDRSTTGIGLVSDGLFHAFSWFATVAALFIVGGLRRERAFRATTFRRRLADRRGALPTLRRPVQHKLKGLHQIRYGVHLTPYDVIWNVLAAVLLAAGIGLWFRPVRRARTAAAG